MGWMAGALKMVLQVCVRLGSFVQACFIQLIVRGEKQGPSKSHKKENEHCN